MKLIIAIEVPIGNEEAGILLTGKIKKGIEGLGLKARVMIQDIKAVDYESIDTSQIT